MLKIIKNWMYIVWMDTSYPYKIFQVHIMRNNFKYGLDLFLIGLI